MLRQCKNCKKLFKKSKYLPKQKFCNRKCSAQSASRLSLSTTIKPKKQIKCDNCKNIFLSKDYNRKFCSLTCSATFKYNKSRDMSHRRIIHRCKCGNKKSKYSSLCTRCFLDKINKEDKVGNNKLSFYASRNVGANTYVHVRTHARRVLAISEILKECKNCKYNKHVEVCHIKAISKYGKNTFLKTVNDLNNLMYLCPNCHWEFDHGLLTLNGTKCNI